jgi:hypothetical protein
MRLRFVAIASGLALTTTLVGCASDTKSGNAFVSPARFMLYTCKELGQQQAALLGRQRQLEQLMAKSKQDAGGGFVNVIAYEPDYQNTLGEMKVLRQQQAEKGCNLPDPYAPGAAAAAAPQQQPAKPVRRKR